MRCEMRCTVRVNSRESECGVPGTVCGRSGYVERIWNLYMYRTNLPIIRAVNGKRGVNS